MDGGNDWAHDGSMDSALSPNLTPPTPELDSLTQVSSALHHSYLGTERRRPIGTAVALPGARKLMFFYPEEILVIALAATGSGCLLFHCGLVLGLPTDTKNPQVLKSLYYNSIVLGL